MLCEQWVAVLKMKALLVMRVVFYFLLGLVFGILSVRTLSERRFEAIPLGVIFGALGLLCLWEVLRALKRYRARPPGDEVKS